jgi:hypothetical protein
VAAKTKTRNAQALDNAAQKLLWGQKLAPHVGDALLRRSGWKSHTTGEPKPTSAPDNLFETVPGDPGVHG